MSKTRLVKNCGIIGTIVIIIGAMFKISHYQYQNLIATIGLIIFAVFWIYNIISILRKDFSMIVRLIWLIVVLIVPIIGAWIYFNVKIKRINLQTPILILIFIFSSSCNGLTQNNTKNMDENSSEKDKQIEESIKAFQNRPIYKELTSEIFDSINDDDLIQSIMDNIWEKMNKKMSNEYKVIKSLSKERQAIYVVWLVEAEVNNGGFNQFYFNSSGQFADQMEESFVLIQAPGFAEIANKANKIYKDNYKEITGDYDGSIESFSESYEDNPLNDLDTEFYNQYETENLVELMTKFIRDNKKQFLDK